MATIEVSEKADWKLFEDVARVLEQGRGGRWKERLDGLDQRYWDLLVDEHAPTLRLERYMGISIAVPDRADDTAQRVCALLNQPPYGQARSNKDYSWLNYARREGSISAHRDRQKSRRSGLSAVTGNNFTLA